MINKTGLAAAVIFLSIFVIAIAQVGEGTINPINPQSGQQPAPIVPLSPGLQPLSTRSQNAGEEALDEAVDPIDPSDDPNEADALSLVGQTGLRGEEPLLGSSDGKQIEEEEDSLWRIRPLFSAGVVYDDNIFISETDRVGDVIFTFAAGLTFELGDYRNLRENYLLAEYVATGFVYVNNPQQDAVNQSASLIGQYRFNKLAVQLESRYQYLTGAEREVGSFATRNLFRNAIRGIYELSPKTELDLELFQQASIYEQYLNSHNYGIKFGGNYNITPKVALGGETIFGISLADESPNQYYAQLRGRAAYNATGKLAFKTSAGIEIRALEEGVRISPVFSLRGEYRPFENTLIALTGYGNVQSSASISDASYLATGVELSLRQLVFQKITTGFAVGYENDNYFSNTTGSEEGRVDNYFYLRPSVSYNFYKWFSAGVFYEFRQNESTAAGDSFYNNRVGFELSAQF